MSEQKMNNPDKNKANKIENSQTEKASGEMTEKKAKEDMGLLAKLSNRIAVGGKIAQRVGRRGFERPNVAISNRIYEQYGVPDPWSPLKKKKVKKWESKLGVSLKLGEAKRQPGRHLMPKEPKKKASMQKQTNAAESWKPKGIPQAKKATHKPPPPKPDRVSTFGTTKKHGVVGKIPIRPDLKTAETSLSEATEPSKNTRHTKSRQSLKKNTKGTSRTTSQSKKSAMTQQEQDRRASLLGQKSATVDSTSSSKTSNSRRLKRTRTTQRAPKITNVEQPSVAEETRQPTPTEPVPQEPLKRTATPSSQPGMEDLFGGTMSKESRPRLGRRKKRS